jgi:hypothetical protein
MGMRPEVRLFLLMAACSPAFSEADHVRGSHTDLGRDAFDVASDLYYINISKQ